jgi:hypothetical protein
MRMRTLKPGFFLNETLAALPPLTRVLYAGLWCAADSAGRLEDRPLRIKAALLPYDVCDIEPMLQALHEHGFVVRYAAADGRRLLAIPTFSRHQNPHWREAESFLPPPATCNTDSDNLCKALGQPEASPMPTLGQPEKGTAEPGGVLGLGSWDENSPVVVNTTTPERGSGGDPAPQSVAGAVGSNGHSPKKPRPLNLHPHATELAEFHGKAARHWKPNANVNPKSANSLRGFTRLLKRAEADRVREVLTWFFRGYPLDYQASPKFDWRPNLLSGATVEEHWDQIESLFNAAQRAEDEGGNHNGRRR